MEMTRLYLIRHGQVVNHHEFRYNGHFDVDITGAGVLQMERLSEFFSKGPVDAVYSSDLQRAVKGALIIADRLGLKPVKVHALRELHLGRWEGLTREEASLRYPEEAWFSFRDLATGKLKGGESLEDLKKRVIPVVIVKRHVGESIAMVAHGGVNRVV
ncbi:MAG: histidine phosphatase family protein [Deltaproteobacteria bacterium]|nr:histidine phosphatase family protein [Deltaproteobacteria bacterium]